MSTENQSKINKLLQLQPSGIVLLSSWLKEQGYSLDLQNRYKKSKWLESIGSGAMKRTGDKIEIEGAVFALQKQLNMSVHIGGKSALSILGKSHYLELNKREIRLFGQPTEKLPQWFVNHNWDQKIKYHQTNLLPADVNMLNYEVRNFSILVSGPVRAIMECIYLSPKEQNLVESYEIMEGLNNLNPATVQHALENCKSIKVKRLFLFMAKKADHAWYKYIMRDRIDLGAGKRSIVRDGTYISEFKITVPKELINNESGI